MIDLTGQVYGELKVIRLAYIGPPPWYKPRWLVSCSCGVEKVVLGQGLRAGSIVSCGHVGKQALADGRARGAADGSQLRGAKIAGVRSAAKKAVMRPAHVPDVVDQVPEYATWRAMKDRCSNPRSTSYRYYGGRGISVCDRWRDSFPNFLADMGPRPTPTHSIDRIDVNGNYEPGNCRWATPKEQVGNRRCSPRNRKGAL